MAEQKNIATYETSNLTNEQGAVINHDVSNILVSASAGTGKTFVMTERIARRINNQETDIRNILVLTFTNNAAANMKSKIEEKIRYAIDRTSDPDHKRYLTEQLEYLPQAYISSFHSFCNRTIHTFSDLLLESIWFVESKDAADENPAHKKALLKSDPRIIDHRQRQEMLKKVIDDVLQRHFEAIAAADQGEEVYAEHLQGFSDLMYFFYNGNSKSCALSLINLYEHLRSLPDYRQWCKDCLALTKAAGEDIYGSATGKFCIDRLIMLAERYQEIKGMLGELINSADATLVKNNKNNRKKIAQQRETLNCIKETLDEVSDHLVEFSKKERRPVEICEAAAEKIKEEIAAGVSKETAAAIAGEKVRSQERRELIEKLNNLAAKLPDLPTMRSAKTDTEEKTQLIHLLRTVVSEFIFHLSGRYNTENYRKRYLYSKMQPILATNWDVESERIAEMTPSLACFINLVLEVDELFAKRRYNLGLLDFSDMEQLALCLVRNHEVNAYYKNLFNEIYVDEFQDTSGIQMTILQELEDGNLFVVGDIKQSIYRFRHAKPEIFLNQVMALKNNDTEGKYFELSVNFRSDSDILNGVNQIFSELMQGGADSQIDYKNGHLFKLEDDQLNEDEEIDYDEIAYIDRDASPSTVLPGRTPRLTILLDDLRDKGQAEVIIAQKVFELVREGRKLRDICVLMDTNKDVQKVVETLTSCGIPCQTKERSFRPQYYEQRLFMAVVNLLDNPLQDHALITVMTSPLTTCGFDETDLALIKELAKSLKKEKSDLISPGDFYAEVIGSEKCFWSDVLTLYYKRQLLVPEYYNQYSTDERIGRRVKSLLPKLTLFVDTVDELRRRVDREACSDILKDIFLESGFSETLLVHPDGLERLGRLQKLFEIVRQYEQTMQPTIRGLAKLWTLFGDQITTSTGEETDLAQRPDVVYVMTIHGSKGLEFPIIIMGDIKLHRPSSQKQINVSEKYGISSKYYTETFGLKYNFDLLQNSVINEEDRMAEFAERLRLLYVGMTRAEEELYLCFSGKIWEERRADLEQLILLRNGMSGDQPFELKEWDLLSLKTGSDLTASALYAAKEFNIYDKKNNPNSEDAVDIALVDLPSALQRIDTEGRSFWRISRYCPVGEPISVEQQLTARYAFNYHSNGQTMVIGSDDKYAPIITIESTQQTDSQLSGAETVDSSSSHLSLSTKQARDLLQSTLAEVKQAESKTQRTDGVQDQLSKQLPLKLTVTELKRQSQLATEQLTELDDGEGQPAAENNLYRNINLNLESLKDVLDIRQEPLGGTVLGTALHTCLQLLDLEAAQADGLGTERVEAAVKRQLQMMVQGGQLSARNVHAIDSYVPNLVTFAQSELAQRAVKSAQLQRQYRLEKTNPDGIKGQPLFGSFKEIPFTLAVPAEQLYRKPMAVLKNLSLIDSRERILVQGVIDLWFDEPNRAVLVDYKSDFLYGSDEEVLKTLEKNYRIQLDIYGEAIRQATGHEDVEQWIWSLRRGKAYAVGGKTAGQIIG
ncbi:MAG: UvrD-helicase domain-containing protein [Fastidiosipilaceae bacterium]|jgi:ATP-dependent helicase/nuclease subunit A